MSDIKKYKKFDLNKGAKLYYVKNKINKSTIVKVNFECGARCDTIPGLAHFTEHMFFTGTETQTKEEISKEYFDFLGVNAATSYDCIHFKGTIFTSKLKEYLAMVTKLITKSTFSPEAVEKEKPVVIQEIVAYNDEYQQKASSFNRYNMVKREEVKYQISGTRKSVESITSEDVKAFVKNYFVANNMKVFVCTPLSPSTVKKYIKDTLINALDVNENLPDLPVYYYSVEDANFYKFKSEDIDKNYVYINFKLNHDYKDLDFYNKLPAISSMLNNFSSGVTKELRLKKSLVYGAKFFWTDYEKNGRVTFLTECQKENINEVIKTLFSYLKRMSENGFTQEQLDITKEQIRHKNIKKVATPDSLMSRLEYFRYYGKVLPEDMVDKAVEKITLDECNALFKEIFVNKNVSLSIYGDAKKEEIMSKAEFKNLLLK